MSTRAVDLTPNSDEATTCCTEPSSTRTYPAGTHVRTSAELRLKSPATTVGTYPPRGHRVGRGDRQLELARHDIGAVFRLMRRFGFSQRAIAALTGITQAEVSEIMSGRRRILGYSVLERLADGF
jgi:Helix-turn-helix domain